jgi:hypothetical protein
MNNEVRLIPFAIIVNPKLGVPVVCSIEDNLARLDIWLHTLSGHSLGGPTLDFMDNVAAASNFPRVHIEVRQEVRGIGYGTVAYSSAAVAADMIAQERLWTKSIQYHAESLPGGVFSGVSSMSGRRSEEADQWWSAAKKSGFATSRYDNFTFDSTREEVTELGTRSFSKNRISLDEASDVIKSMLEVLYKDLDDVEVSEANLYFAFKGTFTRRMKLDVLESDEVYRRNLVIAVPREFQPYVGQAAGGKPLYQTQSPEGWQIISSEALRGVDIASFKPAPLGTLPGPEGVVPIGTREFPYMAGWWMRMLESQKLPQADVDRWRSSFASFGASGAVGGRKSAWRPLPAWTGLP